MKKTKNKNIIKQILTIFLITIISLFLFSFSLLKSSNNILSNLKQTLIQKVSAEDDEDEKDDSEEKDDAPKLTTTTQETVTTVENPTPVVKTVRVPTGAYAIDTDGDKLVDAIDPDPKIPQQMYFTDSDGDSIPDVFDQYPGQNDFQFVDDTDSNNNGIWDSLEN